MVKEWLKSGIWSLVGIVEKISVSSSRKYHNNNHDSVEPGRSSVSPLMMGTREDTHKLMMQLKVTITIQLSTLSLLTLKLERQTNFQATIKW